VFAGEDIWERQGADRWICRWRTRPLMQKVEETTLVEKSSAEQKIWKPPWLKMREIYLCGVGCTRLGRGLSYGFCWGEETEVFDKRCREASRRKGTDVGGRWR
jgi:hypothetical protein